MEDTKDRPGLKGAAFSITLDKNWFPEFNTGKILLNINDYEASIDADSPDTIVFVNKKNKTNLVGKIIWTEIKDEK